MLDWDLYALDLDGHNTSEVGPEVLDGISGDPPHPLFFPGTEGVYPSHSDGLIAIVDGGGEGVAGSGM